MTASPRRIGLGSRQVQWVTLALAAATTTMAADLDIAWDDSGRFERRLTLAPGEFAEACGALRKGQLIAWSFKADGPLNFNIHYHEDRRLVVPENHDGAANAVGKLAVGADQVHCWMWTNKSSATVKLAIALAR